MIQKENLYKQNIYIYRTYFRSRMGYEKDFRVKNMLKMKRRIMFSVKKHKQP